MAGYRGDGYGVYGDHGDEDFRDEMRGGRDERMRDRDDDWRMRGRHDRRDEDRGFMFDRGRDDDRGGWRDDRHSGRSQGMMDQAGERVRSWMRDDDDDDHGRRDDSRGQGFLERSGYEARSWKRDDDDDQRRGRGAPPPMGLTDRSRMGGGLGTGRGEQRFTGRGPHDHYLSWRERQMAELDRDYDDYCRENEQKFSSDFESWRQGRRGQGMGGGMADAPSSQGVIAGSSDRAMTGDKSGSPGISGGEGQSSIGEGSAARENEAGSGSSTRNKR